MDATKNTEPEQSNSEVETPRPTVLLTSSERPAGENTYNPYFLHHSDTTNLVLVSEVLTEDNYVTWSRSMLIGLAIRNKLGFVDGTITKPADGDLLPLWTRNNYVVIAWILNSVAKNISSSIIFSDSARAIWLDLKDRFQKRNGPRIFNLKKRLTTIKQEQDTVTGYFSKLKSVWDEYSSYRPSCTCCLCSCNGLQEIENFVQYEYLLMFLSGLNDKFGHARSQILLMEPPPDISKAFSLVVQEEEQRYGDSVDVPAVALAVTAPKSSGQGRGKAKSVCTHCGIQGHTVDKCYKLHGYPPGYRQNRGNNKASQNQNQNQSNKSVVNNSVNQAGVDGGSSVEDSFIQCQNILNMLHARLTANKTDIPSTSSGVHMAGKVHFEDDWEG